MITLYHYVHCPFCIRVRMALGYLNLAYQSKVLAYHDEKTPIDLTGIKMLPIIKDRDFISNESLVIISHIDTENKLLRPNHIEMTALETTLNDLSKEIHSLAMPQWIWTAEFNEESRNYFQKKKEVKRGPFKDLVAQSNILMASLNEKLSILEKELKPFYQHYEFTLYDILLASHLWGLYIVPEFQFSAKWHQYLQNIKKITHFNYHEDFWK